MSLLIEIERELDKRCEIAGAHQKQFVYKKFAAWIVDEFERRPRKIEIVCGTCGVEWQTGHICK